MYVYVCVWLTSRCHSFFFLCPGRSFLPRPRPLPVLLVTGGGYLGYHHYRSSSLQKDGAPRYLASTTEVGVLLLHNWPALCRWLWGLSVEMDKRVWVVSLPSCLKLSQQMHCQRCLVGWFALLVLWRGQTPFSEWHQHYGRMLDWVNFVFSYLDLLLFLTIYFGPSCFVCLASGWFFSV